MQEITVTHAQELSFALIKVSAYIRRVALRHSIDRLAYKMLESVAIGKAEDAFSALLAIRQFVELGKNLYEIETNNARILLREIETLSSEIKKSTESWAQLGIESIFTKKVAVNKPKKTNTANEIPAEIVISEAEIGNELVSAGEPPTAPSQRAYERQERMLSMVSDASDKRMQLRDFMVAFPGISERTLRYDLKHLCESGKLVRAGEGGPGSYYTYPQV